MTSWDTEKNPDHIGVFDTEITIVFVIIDQLFLKLWIFQLLCIPFVSESVFFSSPATNFQMCNLSRYILTITWIHVSLLSISNASFIDMKIGIAYGWASPSDFMQSFRMYTYIIRFIVWRYCYSVANIMS